MRQIADAVGVRPPAPRRPPRPQAGQHDPGRPPAGQDPRLRHRPAARRARPVGVGRHRDAVLYMAPEQILGEEPDERTDVYALGVTFFQLATGTLPFTAGQRPAGTPRAAAAGPADARPGPRPRHRHADPALPGQGPATTARATAAPCSPPSPALAGQGTRMKVALIGTHGVGKTTLCFELAARLKRRDVNVEMVREVARRCPLPDQPRDRRSRPSRGSCTPRWPGRSRPRPAHQLVVCDRSVLDNYCYLVHATGHQPTLGAAARARGCPPTTC